MSSFTAIKSWSAIVTVTCLALTLSNPVASHGAVEVTNAPEQIVQARINQQANVEGLSVVILDAPQPGILMSYRGGTLVIVEDSHGHALLRFSQDGVMANRASPDWPALSTSRAGIAAPEHEDTRWVSVSDSSSFGWLDPRLDTANGDSHWQIPVRTESGVHSEIRGSLSRVQLPSNQP